MWDNLPLRSKLFAPEDLFDLNQQSFYICLVCHVICELVVSDNKT